MSLAKQYLAREGAYSSLRVSYVELGQEATPKLPLRSNSQVACQPKTEVEGLRKSQTYEVR